MPPETAKAADYRETRGRHRGPLIRLLPAGPDGGQMIGTVARCCFAMTSALEDGSRGPDFLVMTAFSGEAGLFCEMDGHALRTFGNMLLRMADEAGGPKAEPEVAAKRDGGA